MSPSRLFVITVVLIAGAFWFLLPTKNAGRSPSEGVAVSPSNQTESSAPSLNPSGANSNEDHDLSRRLAQTQSGAAASATPSETEPLPGEAALRALQAESVRPWTARRSGLGNGIKTLVRGLWTTGNGSDVQGAATAFVHDYSESLLGVPADQVRFSRAETTDRTKVIYDQYVDDTRVYGSTLTLFFESGGLSRVQNDLVAKAPTRSEAPSDFTAEQAFAQFNAREGSIYTLTSAQMNTVLFPGPTSLVYSYDFEVRDSGTGKTYRVLYDAEARTLIKKLPTQVQ